MSGFKNPSTSVVSSTSIIISVITSASYIVDEISLGVITIPYVRNGPLSSLAIVRTNDVVGQVPIYTFTFTTDSSTGDLTSSSTAIVLVAFPVGFIYNKTTTTSCSIKNVGGSTVPTTCIIAVVATDTY
jgi:hypothetical protein